MIKKISPFPQPLRSSGTISKIKQRRNNDSSRHSSSSSQGLKVNSISEHIWAKVLKVIG